MIESLSKPSSSSYYRLCINEDTFCKRHFKIFSLVMVFIRVADSAGLYPDPTFKNRTRILNPGFYLCSSRSRYLSSRLMLHKIRIHQVFLIIEPIISYFQRSRSEELMDKLRFDLTKSDSEPVKKKYPDTVFKMR